MKVVYRVALLIAVCLCLPAASSLAADGEIQWIRNVFQGFEKSCAEKKPLVVLFMDGGAEFSRKLNREVLDRPEMHALASRGVFVWAEAVDEDNHGNYRRLKDELKIERFPVMVVLDAGPDELQEVGRIVGYFPPEEFVGHFSHLLQLWHDRHADVLVPVPAKDRAVPEGWGMYESRAAGVQIALPGKPSTIVADDNVKHFVFSAATADNNLDLTILARDFSTLLVSRRSADELLRMEAGWCAGAKDGTVEDAQSTVWEGHPALRFRIQRKEGDPAVALCVLIGRRMYELVAEGPEVSFGQDSVNAFFQSFQVLVPAQARHTTVAAQ